MVLHIDSDDERSRLQEVSVREVVYIFPSQFDSVCGGLLRGR